MTEKNCEKCGATIPNGANVCPSCGTAIKQETGTINGYEYVDLGLSVKWATCNVGATSPSDYGDYFVWEAAEAACSDWGGRLPTADEIEELCGKRKCKCKWEWTTMGKYEGYKVTGPNGNSIFLPAAGWRNDALPLHDIGKGHYWSATSSGEQSAYELYFCRSRFVPNGNICFSKDCFVSNVTYRSYGFSVRPVSD